MSSLNYMIMKDKEFAVAGALCGMEQFFGSVDVKGEELDKQEVYMLIYQLFKKGFAVEQDEEIVLVQPLKEMFRLLKGADRMLSIVNPLTSENQSFYYRTDEEDCVNLQKTWEEPDSIRMRLIQKEKAAEIGEASQLYPKQVLDERSAQTVQLTGEEEVTKEYLEICLYDLTSEERLAEVHVKMEGLNDMLTFDGGEKHYREIYELKRLKKLITSLIREEEVQ